MGAAFAIGNAVAAVVMLRLVQRGGAGFQPGWRATPAWALFRRILQVGAVALACTALIGLLVALLPLQFAQLFTPDADVAAMVAGALRFIGVALGLLADGLISASGVRAGVWRAR
ncbi:MAG: hypothetical protein QE285_05485 [Aquabacterium sp.]|nr:hypothetical protein [Aquabacterium sp.]